jgi:hypothetical protein
MNFLRKTFLAFLFSVFVILLLVLQAKGWGFFAHKCINYYAVFTLPPEMIGFYKYHIRELAENAVNPDKRRYAVEGEAPCHYIDIDYYGEDAIYLMPRKWEEAVQKHSEDTLMKYGIVPWHVYVVKQKLTQAFKRRDKEAILRYSADLGHYIGDAHVPLHTTLNYNGQLTGQKGIHAFWESRLPELFASDYDYFVGKATYLPDPQERIWEAVVGAHLALDSVLGFEKELSLAFAEDKKYAYEERNGKMVRQYSYDFAKAYHNRLSGQVERQMRSSIKMLGDFWLTCWVDAGQPDINSLVDEPKPKSFTLFPKPNPDEKGCNH